MTKPFWCRIGFHRYVGYSPRTVIAPKVGEYDPRSDEERSYKTHIETCANCGREREYVNYEPLSGF